MIKAFRNFMSRRTINYKVRNHVMNSFSNILKYFITRESIHCMISSFVAHCPPGHKIPESFYHFNVLNY